MLSAFLNLDNYGFNPYALPVFSAAMVAFILGLIILIRERGSMVSLLYFFFTITVSVWQLGAAGGYLATNDVAAYGWAKFGHLGIILMPAALFHFTLSVLGMVPGRRALIAANWIMWTAFCFTLFSTDMYLAGVYQYSWGYFARYNLIMLPIVAMYPVVLGACVAYHRRAWLAAKPGTTAKRRATLFYTVFLVGGISAVDFLPAFGVPIYPFGYVPATLGIIIIAYSTLRYRLIDITPASAASQIINTMGDGVLVLDPEGIVRLANRAAENVLGYDASLLKAAPLKAAIGDNPLSQKLIQVVYGETLRNAELDYRHPDGSERVISASASIMHGSEGEPVGYVCILTDVTEQKRAADKIYFLAHHDSLTNLPNRALFNEQLSHALANAKRHGRMLALLYFDLDRFKRVNDTFGHSMGDRLLKSVAERFAECLRGSDAITRADPKFGKNTVARLGGDEFIVYLSDISRVEDAARVASRILTRLREPIFLDEQEMTVGVSIGISVYPHDGEDVESLAMSADTAMHFAKDAGRNNYQFFTRSMNEEALERFALENNLRKALEREELVVFYQPQVDTQSGVILGMEALVRWQHPERGLIPPNDFIPLAEETGLIIPMGEWVMRTACAQAMEWTKKGYPPLRVGVNLSAHQFRQKDLPKIVARILATSGLQPELLELEITEGTIMYNLNETISLLNEFKAMGVRLAIDDFGTGYSSLSYLKRFPIDTLKIDRSFIKDIPQDPHDAAISAAVITMSKGLKLQVVAEGVETDEQLAFMRAHGCCLIQGFYFSRPIPAAAFERLLLLGFGKHSASA